MKATFAGPNLADLYYLTGLTLPSTHTYQLSGKLTREQDIITFHDFGGTVGDSDLHGEVTVDDSGDKPYLKADLRLAETVFRRSRSADRRAAASRDSQFIIAKSGLSYCRRDGAPRYGASCRRSAPIGGQTVARAKLQGIGNSIHKAASTAAGTVTFVVPHGEIRRTFAELLGINVASALGRLLTNDQRQVDGRCAVAGFSAKNGIMTLNQFALDTPVVLATGEGTVTLKMKGSILR